MTAPVMRLPSLHPRLVASKKMSASLQRFFGQPMRYRILAMISIALALAACGPIDTLKDGFGHSRAVSESLEKTLGVKSFVGFSWSNGSLDSVSVTFQGIPANEPLADIVEKSKQAVASEFKQLPSQVVISFALKT
jgi:hypothetical protein